MSYKLRTRRHEKKGTHLSLVKGGNTWKNLSFQKLQRGTSSRGDVRHVSCASTLFSGSNRVSASNNSDGTLFLRQVGKNINNSEGTLGEFFELEHTHGSVHDDSFARRKGFFLFSGGSGTVIKTHPSIRKGISDNNIRRKQDLLSELFGLCHNFLGGVNEVILNKRSSNIETLGLQESEDHTSSNDDSVTFVKKSIEDSDLGRNLGSADNGSQWFFAVGNST